MKKIAISGMGRMGQAALKIALKKKDFNVVAINDPHDPKELLYHLKYDSVYGKSEENIKLINDNLLAIGKNRIKRFGEREPEKLPWKKLGIDIVLECTGAFKTYEDASKHLIAGAKKVLISAPAKDEKIDTIVLGVNDKKIKSQKILSCASCTTNCAAPVVKAINDSLKIMKGLITTVHAYTASQSLVDSLGNKDLRDGRAGACNIIPSSTGAAKAVVLAIPELKGKLDAIAFRVPVPTGSVIDCSFLVKKKTSIEKVNEVLKKAAKTKMKGILDYCEDELVSSDIIQSPYSSIVDATSTNVVDGNLVKIVSWYDNEWGYANRLVEMAGRV